MLRELGSVRPRPGAFTPHQFTQEEESPIRSLALSIVLLCATGVLADSRSWYACSGVMSYDSSIPLSQRFSVHGDSALATLAAGALHYDDGSTTQGISILRDYTSIDPLQDWTYEVTARVYSSERDNLNYAFATDVSDNTASGLLLIAPDAIGFSGDICTWSWLDSYSVDTTDAYHTYRENKTGDTLSVFMDDMVSPCLTVNHADLMGSARDRIVLGATSDQGLADFDISECHWNVVPEPTTLILFGLSALMLRRR